jgi:hypothetical protein
MQWRTKLDWRTSQNASGVEKGMRINRLSKIVLTISYLSMNSCDQQPERGNILMETSLVAQFKWLVPRTLNSRLRISTHDPDYTHSIAMQSMVLYNKQGSFLEKKAKTHHQYYQYQCYTRSSARKTKTISIPITPEILHQTPLIKSKTPRSIPFSTLQPSPLFLPLRKP